MRIGRNQPCPCGSGAKYKKCCLNKKPEPKPKARAKKLTPAERTMIAMMAAGRLP